jgi:hypothetical protein
MKSKIKSINTGKVGYQQDVNEIRFFSSPEDQDKARLKEAINRTNAEKFQFLMNLMKMQQIMKKGKIHYKQ